MGEHEEKHEESLMVKLAEKIHGHDSSSDSDIDKPSESSIKAKVFRLFGRERSVHHISAGVLGVATVIWVLFELLEYHLLTLVCHVLIFALVILFLWSNAYAFINKSPLCIPEVHIPKNPVIEFAEALRFETNLAFTVFRDIASGRDLKKFLYVIAVLWILSIVGSWCNFATLFYIVFVLLHTVPVLYEKYEDKVDPFAEKAMHEIKKQYVVFNANVLSKIPRGPSKEKED
ncbi:hypothetical protein Goari_026279 [Gossypium aridum]|uniref:Reticulon-like protein n=1 Tax=Gossypium aridum TaxID=34290 RepID=A0A7J8XBP1_GOSAI|nr:hypothetical protein [Gossypium aridum]